MPVLLMWIALGCSTSMAPAPEGDPDLKITQLEWMVGRWLRAEADMTSEETWGPLSGGTMMGSNRTVNGDDTKMFEFMQLQQSDDGVVYRAWPGGGESTPFALTDLDSQHAVFANPGHDYPQRVEYTRVGDDLTARISLTDGTNGGEWSWSLAGSEPPSDDRKATGIGGIFFKSKDPEALRQWYAKHLGLVVNEYGTLFEFRTAEEPGHKGYLQWSPFNDQTTYFQPSDKPFMINYRVVNLDSLLEQLDADGVPIVGEVEKTEYGDFAHIMDPEGTKIELWQPVDAVFTRLYDGKTTR